MVGKKCKYTVLMAVNAAFLLKHTKVVSMSVPSCKSGIFQRQLKSKQRFQITFEKRQVNFQNDTIVQS